MSDNEGRSPSSQKGEEYTAESSSSKLRNDSSDEDNSNEASRSTPAVSEQDVTESKSGETPAEVLPAAANAHVQGDWQAIWSPQHNAYYFFNMRTNETTWTNPLASADASGSSVTGAYPTASSSRFDSESAALAQGIDPGLAFLDPTLAAGPSNPAALAYTAKFNARTGAFARPDARDPEHVSEYERMKRMNSFYFDMDAWQKEVEERAAEEAESGKKRKKPTKKDLVGHYSLLSTLRTDIPHRNYSRSGKDRKSWRKLPGYVHRPFTNEFLIDYHVTFSLHFFSNTRRSNFKASSAKFTIFSAREEVPVSISCVTSPSSNTTASATYPLRNYVRSWL